MVALRSQGQNLALLTPHLGFRFPHSKLHTLGAKHTQRVKGVGMKILGGVLEVEDHKG